MLARRLLICAFVVFLFVIGADKVFHTNLIIGWQGLVGPVVRFLLPFSAHAIVSIEGLIEILLGLSLLTPWKVYGIAIIVATIFLVTIDLFILGFYSLAMREIMLIVMCAAMYLLDENTPEFALRA
jgi:hypothetical protein